MRKFITKHVSNKKPQIKMPNRPIVAKEQQLRTTTIVEPIKAEEIKPIEKVDEAPRFESYKIERKNEMGKEVDKKNHIRLNAPQNKKKINEKVMTTSEKIAMAQNVLNDEIASTKRIKRDKGLIERAESSKTILTEDNKELLND